MAPRRRASSTKKSNTAAVGPDAYSRIPYFPCFDPVRTPVSAPVCSVSRLRPVASSREQSRAVASSCQQLPGRQRSPGRQRLPAVASGRQRSP
eukprot:3915375-Prymnesium_polylepis.1